MLSIEDIVLDDTFQLLPVLLASLGEAIPRKIYQIPLVIDKKMIEVYKLNHNPKYSFHESITTFAKRKDLPKELYELDILDGSPPCSSFSMAGNREKDWGKEKIFREGQAEQVLDTLFFDFIDLAKELQPKVVVAENVKGLLL